MARVYDVNEIGVAIKTLQAMAAGVFIPDGLDEQVATKLTAEAISAALTIIATGLGEIIAEHERLNSAN